jgi:hypothetical protein
MSTTVPATELDFDTLKKEIVDYIKTNPTFSDYNFAGSALNTIIDLLAYNTHTNSFYANMVHSEGFLDTAQKRSSVVSKAKELGYVPRSCVASTSYLDVSVSGPSASTQLYISRGTSFTSSNDNGTYSFYTVENSTAAIVGSAHVFSNIKIVAGVPTTNLFSVDTVSNIRSIFTIPNTQVDTSTLKVYVRDSVNSLQRTEYTLGKDVFELKSDSNVYFLQESYDGFFQIFFGNDVIGKQPINGNVIDVDYYVASYGTLPNECRTFSFDGSITNSTSISLIINQVSFGGSDKETLESIKFNAVRSNSARNRSVSSIDYGIILKDNFDFINTVSVWGGEDNIPPVYGKVFISIQPVSGYTISDSVKSNVITTVIRANSVMTVGVEYVDPTYLELFFSTKIKYSPVKTLLSKSDIEGSVKTAVSDYVTTISTFNKDYLESSLISKITSIDASIQSVIVKKRVGFIITPLFGVETSHKNTIFNPILEGSITSSKFLTVFSGVLYTVSIQETGNFDNMGNNRLGLYTFEGILVREIGYVNLLTGEFNITLNVNSYPTDSRFVSIQFSLIGVDINTARNQILKLAQVNDSSTGENYNTVLAEVYGK